MKSKGKSIFGNEFGLGLPEVMMTAGLLGSIALGVTKMMENDLKKSAGQRSRQEAQDLRDEFYVSMSKEACGIVPPGESLGDKNLILNVATPATIALDRLYGPYGQEFKPGDEYGKITIGNGSPFIITPPSKKSSLVKNIPAGVTKTPGGYYEMGGQIAAELTVNFKKSKAAGQGALPMRFLMLLTIEAGTNRITDCQSIAEISAAKEACDAAKEPPDGGVEFIWNENNLRCDVTVNTDGGGSDGVYDTDEAGDVDPALYILSSIP